jgi:hypothetical protein
MGVDESGWNTCGKRFNLLKQQVKFFNSLRWIMAQISKTPEVVIQLLRTFKERYQTEYQIKSLGIFGSYARRQMNANSDIDIFFETDAPNLLKTAHLRQELEILLELPVDLIRLRSDMNPNLKSRIEKDAWYV